MKPMTSKIRTKKRKKKKGKNERKSNEGPGWNSSTGSSLSDTLFAFNLR